MLVKGGGELIDQYIKQYGKRLYGLCITLCKNTFDADDLYQETWLKVLRSIDQYDSSREFEPWLTRICVNTYRNVLRRHSVIAEADFSSNEEKDAFLQSLPAPEQADYTPLYEAIDGLPEKLRLTVILFYFRDADIVSTAAALKVPTGTIKSRLNKARKLLKEMLENETDLQF